MSTRAFVRSASQTSEHTTHRSEPALADHIVHREVLHRDTQRPRRAERGIRSLRKRVLDAELLPVAIGHLDVHIGSETQDASVRSESDLVGPRLRNHSVRDLALHLLVALDRVAVAVTVSRDLIDPELDDLDVVVECSEEVEQSFSAKVVAVERHALRVRRREHEICSTHTGQ